VIPFSSLLILAFVDHGCNHNIFLQPFTTRIKKMQKSLDNPDHGERPRGTELFFTYSDKCHFTAKISDSINFPK